MRYKVVLSVDCPSDERIGLYKPVITGMKKTEGDSEYDYGHLESVWEKGHHRKWIGFLSQSQFDRIIRQYDFVMSTTPTMGMLTYEGHYPAISFYAISQEAIIDMYVCPIPSNKVDEKKFPANEAGWTSILEHMEKAYA